MKTNRKDNQINRATAKIASEENSRLPLLFGNP